MRIEEKVLQLRCVFTGHQATGSNDVVDYRDNRYDMISRQVRCNKCGLIILIEKYRTTFWDSGAAVLESERFRK